MANLVSTDVLLILNNRATMRRDEFTADIVDENIVRIRSGCGSIEWKLDVRKDTVDDELSDTVHDLFDIISSFSIGGGGTGEGVPTGGGRQILSWDENGNAIATNFTPDHWSEFADGAPTSGQWLAAAQFDTEEQPSMGFVEVSTLETSIAESEGMIPFYTQGGQLRVGTPQFPENAVPLILLDSRIPAPPATGTFTLQSVNGVVGWVAV